MTDSENTSRPSDALPDDLFSSLPSPQTAVPQTGSDVPAPGSRRARREGTPETPPAALAEESTATRPVVWSTAPTLEQLFDKDPLEADSVKERRKRGRKGCLPTLIVFVVVVGLIVGGGLWAWNTYGTQISESFGWGPADDWEEGVAEGETVVTISQGDTGGPISNTLFEAGVTRTEDVFYDYLIAEQPNATFYPGVFQLQKKMTAEDAFAALQNEENRLEDTVLITEGLTYPSALTRIAEGTGIPLEELQAAAANYTQFGIPPEAPSIEGFLFPATYTFGPETTAVEALQRLVDEMFQRLDAQGVAPEDRLRVLTLAGLIQREAGSNDDMPKIARVFLNRIDQGKNLESDATVAYGTGNLDTVWTTDAERADANNPYNTYVHAGLPVGPIGLPGEHAIAAAISPADGPWMYFVPVNLATGETVFSSTFTEHEAAVARLQDWCAESEENGAYCD